MPIALALSCGGSLVFAEHAAAASCTVSTAGLGFGTYVSKQPAPLDSTSYVSVSCTAGTPYLLGMDNGLNFTSSRRQRNGAYYLDYDLYLDSGRSVVWGMNPASGMKPGTGDGTLQSIPVFGRIPALQEPPDGSYSDTVLVTVEYSP